MRRLSMVVALLVLPGCAPGTPDDTGTGAATASSDAAATDAAGKCEHTADADFPDVIGVGLSAVGDREFRVSATLCSAYDSPDRYADAWRVRTVDGDVLGVRELAHDHTGEQPFTRSLAEPITIPEGVDTIVVEGRDQANGWGGSTAEVEVPTSGSP